MTLPVSVALPAVMGLPPSPRGNTTDIPGARLVPRMEECLRSCCCCLGGLPPSPDPPSSPCPLHPSGGLVLHKLVVNFVQGSSAELKGVSEAEAVCFRSFEGSAYSFFPCYFKIVAIDTYHEIYHFDHFRVYNSMAFSTVLDNHHYLVPEHFHHPKRRPHTYLAVSVPNLPSF